MSGRRPLFSSLSNLPATMKIPSQPQTKTTLMNVWVPRKPAMKEIGVNKLAMVAEMMNEFTREENQAYSDKCKIQSAMMAEDWRKIGQLEDEKNELLIRVQVMDSALRGMIEVIGNQERELNAAIPGRPFGVAIGLDRRNIPHVMTIIHDDEGEFPVEQEVLNMLAEEYDTDVTIMEDSDEESVTL